MKTLMLTILVAGVTAAAEATQARATVGVTAFTDDNLQYHATFGTAVRIYLSRRWSVEPEYLFMARLLDHHDNAVWGNFAYDFRDRDQRVIPYWFAGPGFIVSSTKFGTRTITNSSAAGSTGAGVRVFVGDRWFVAPQFRVGLVTEAAFSELAVSVGYAWKR